MTAPQQPTVDDVFDHAVQVLVRNGAHADCGECPHRAEDEMNARKGLTSIVDHGYEIVPVDLLRRLAATASTADRKWIELALEEDLAPRGSGGRPE